MACTVYNLVILSSSSAHEVKSINDLFWIQDCSCLAVSNGCPSLHVVTGWQSRSCVGVKRFSSF